MSARFKLKFHKELVMCLYSALSDLVQWKNTILVSEFGKKDKKRMYIL